MNSELSIFWKNIKKNWHVITLITLLVILVVTGLTFTQSLKYKSSSKLIVVQEYKDTVDPYAASKSTRYLSDILAQVVYSTSFFDQVVDSGFNVKANDYGNNPRDRKKNWEKNVDVSVAGDTGILIINTYNENPTQAEQINRAVSYTLKSKHGLYHGGGSMVSVRTIEDPINSRWPVKPNVFLNFVLAVVLGFGLGVLYIYLFPNAKIRLWPKRKNETKTHEHVGQTLNGEEKIQENNWNQLGDMIEKKQDEIMPRERTIDDLVDKAEASQEDDSNNDFNRGNIDQFIK